MKLRDLRRYLKNGKLGFEERSGNRHLHYAPQLGNKIISLPTILAVSNGDGDVALMNLKGVARSLGLTLNELRESEACRIGRECVLLLLAWEMLCFCLRRQQQISDLRTGEAGVKAMAVSVQHLIVHVRDCRSGSWCKEESEALARVLPEIKSAQANLLLKDVVRSLLEVTQQD